MAKHHPEAHTAGGRHDYLPAAGSDAMLPFYDLMSRVFGVRKIHRTLLRYAEISPGARVLEIGCGTGSLTALTTSTHPDASITGTDPDPLALARAKRKVAGRTGVRLERAYAQDLPFEDGAFDRVLSAFMLHHLDGEVKDAAAAEVLRCCDPEAGSISSTSGDR